MGFPIFHHLLYSWKCLAFFFFSFLLDINQKNLFHFGRNFLNICWAEMGITGELVRSVFSKGHGHQAMSSGSERRKWGSSVRSYLCGDELSSVLAAEDSASARNEADFSSFRSNVATNTSTETKDVSTVCAEEDTDTASVRSSEATVNQPLPLASELKNRVQKQNSTYKLFQQEDAALIIQSAFRNFLAKKGRDDEAKTWYDEEKLAAITTPSRESIGTSVEVQTGNSSDVFSIKKERDRDDFRHAMRRGTGAQVLRIQEDWDDSTVSSVISKMRMQNRLEAATRRERALAYAFSQQLRICSKKKQNTTNGEEENMGWSWLERWMAARQPEMNFTEDSENQKTLVRKRMLDAAMEEKESCGSNEVSSLVEICKSLPKNVPRPTNKGRTQSRRSFSRQNSASSHLSPKDAKKVEEEKEKRKRQKQPGNKRDVKNGTASACEVVGVQQQHETGQ